MPKTPRRRFIVDVAAAGAGAALGPLAAVAGPARSRVVLVRCPDLPVRGSTVARKPLRRMLEAGLRKLAGAADARAALARWVRPVDTVGLKVNCLAGRHMSTHVELVEALVELLAARGVPRQQMIAFDRSDQDLRKGGYGVRTSGKDYRCIGNDRAGYESKLTVMPSGASRFSRVATEQVSVLINLPILKDHGLAGVTAALKNNFGLVHNPNKFHLNGCDPHVAEVNAARGLVRHKQRLVVCDALRVQVDGGPAYHPAHAEAYRGLLLATDPVALDAIAAELIDELRSARKLPSLGGEKRAPRHIATAARQGLGIAQRSRIELVRVDVPG